MARGCDTKICEVLARGLDAITIKFANSAGNELKQRTLTHWLEGKVCVGGGGTAENGLRRRDVKT